MPGTTLKITEFRAQAGPVLDDVVHQHRPRAISRGARDLALLVGADDLELLVADRVFRPKVYREGGAVSVWLPELDIYGRAATLQEAREDLVEEVRVYVEEYQANAPSYLAAPNRAGHYPYVLKALLADARDRLKEALFARPKA